MIHIRHSTFETNSSSTSVFCIPKDNNNLQIPKSMKMSELSNGEYWITEDASIKDKISCMYIKAKNEGSSEEFLSYLHHIGIEIIYDIDNYDFNNYMFGHFMSEKDLTNFLFNNESKYLDDPDYEKLESLEKDFDFVTIRE